MIADELTHIPEDLGKMLHQNHMELLGIENTMRLAHASNYRREEKQNQWRRELFANDLDSLLKENGAPATPPLKLKDGWALDKSMSLPHLDRILDSSKKIIEERGGKRQSNKGTYRSYFQDMWKPDSDPAEYPEYVDFSTSSELIQTVANYLESIPALSTTLPSGIRFVESNAEYDDQPDSPHDSQLYHIDYYSLPNVYVLVLLEDTEFANGPWTFLPRSVSLRAKEELGYWKRGKGYRCTDEEIFSVVDKSEVIEFTGKRGEVLFIESSGCFHFGSRNSVKPRFQLMLGYTGTCRTDFSESFIEPKRYSVGQNDPLLRRLVLDKTLLPQD